MPLVCRHGPFSWNGTMRRRVSSAAIWERLTGPYQPASLACFVYLSRLSKKLRRNSKLSLNSASSSRSPTRWSTRPGEGGFRVQSLLEPGKTGKPAWIALVLQAAPTRPGRLFARRRSWPLGQRQKHRTAPVTGLTCRPPAISSGSINGMVERTRGVSLARQILRVTYMCIACTC